jgi:hypothetical protein
VTLDCRVRLSTFLAMTHKELIGDLSYTAFDLIILFPDYFL